jgi:uncharacterized membrane protein YedE/YeeE
MLDTGLRAALYGGLMIGAAAALFYWLNGRIAGVSGIFGDLFLDRKNGHSPWRLAFVGGLLLGYLLVRAARPELGQIHLQASPVGMADRRIAGGLRHAHELRMYFRAWNLRGGADFAAIARSDRYLHAERDDHIGRGTPFRVVAMRPLVALGCGTLFGAGLTYAGMTDPARVLGFLDVFGDWDPALALVMAGALLVSLPAFQWARRHPRPLLDIQFFLPERFRIDADLVLGAGLLWYRLGHRRSVPRPGACRTRVRYAGAAAVCRRNGDRYVPAQLACTPARPRGGIRMQILKRMRGSRRP